MLIKPNLSLYTYTDTLFKNRLLYFAQGKKKNTYTWGVVLTFILYLATCYTQLEIIPI